MTKQYLEKSPSASRAPHDILALVAGAALFLSPLAFGFGGGAVSWAAYAAGALVAAVSVKMLFTPAEWNKWAYIVLGLGTFVAPWVLGFSGTTDALWTFVVLGLAVAAAGLWRLFAPLGSETSGHVGPDAHST
ncbi:SPW repeat protein (plasmid) [Skermanella mucosa]|uniref:SPW repeat protein n=1 Tax=Skermanella mucosa TaxID=1789672 RepID=UPI00192B385F|nr:SPW repeat protein [Skermanella mucosa]UEM25299.1 SPW repeat protein [Skermanella mucosa]